MADNACHQQFTWELSGKFPKGPDFGKIAGIVEFDRIMSEVVTVSGGDSKDPGLKYPDDNSEPFKGCTILAITAPTKDNGDVDIHKYLKYAWGDGPNPDWTPFGLGPLVLLGSVTKLIPDVKNIMLKYEPPADECANTTGKNPRPPTKATLNVLIGIVRDKSSDACDQSKR
jgi:hypothetical protein